MNHKLFFLTFLICFSSCDFVSDKNSLNIAKYGDAYLSKEEFVKMMDGVKKEDSVIRANSVINNWAIEKILTERAELNLNETKLQKISSLVKEYKSSLLSEAYLEALINSTINLEIDSVEIQSFYEKNKTLFKLNEDIFKLAFIELPLDFSDTYQIRSKITKPNINVQNPFNTIQKIMKSDQHRTKHVQIRAHPEVRQKSNAKSINPPNIQLKIRVSTQK